MEKLTVLSLAGLLSLSIPVFADGPARIVTVAALGIRGDGVPGMVNYILIQFDRTAGQNGPIVQFNEIALGGGSLVGDEWKEGVHRAVRAVTRTVGDDGRDWLITIKNRSMTAFTDGASASAAVAVGIMAAYYGDALAPEVALSGQITADGRLDVVGGLPDKIAAAAAARYRTVVIPREQHHLPDWTTTTDTAARKRIHLIPASTLQEAYQAMTGQVR